MAESRPPILVVDDESEILFSLRSLLRRDFTVHTAQSGAEALGILQQHPVHVILTDQRMTAMTGVELLGRARVLRPESIRILFTGYADIKSVVEAINRGQVYRYLTKPWDPDELLDLLREACAQHDRLAEKRQLLLELSDHLQRDLSFLSGLAPDRSEAAELVQTGEALQARLRSAISQDTEMRQGSYCDSES